MIIFAYRRACLLFLRVLLLRNLRVLCLPPSVAFAVLPNRFNFPKTPGFFTAEGFFGVTLKDGMKRDNDRDELADVFVLVDDVSEPNDSALCGSTAIIGLFGLNESVCDGNLAIIIGFRSVKLSDLGLSDFVELVSGLDLKILIGVS